MSRRRGAVVVTMPADDPGYRTLKTYATAGAAAIGGWVNMGLRRRAGGSRRSFLAALPADDASRLRGRGWALRQALIALPFYWHTNTGIVAQARQALSRVPAEDGEP